MTEVTTATEETGEEIEGVASLTVTAFLVLFETFVAVLIVDLACFGFDKGFVGFGDFDKLLLDGLIATTLNFGQ